MLKNANRPPITDEKVADIESIDDGTDEDRYGSDIFDMFDDSEGGNGDEKD